MAIYLVRHGQSVGNVKRVFQGSMDYPLTDFGITQATALGEWLNGYGISPICAYTSPLKRAKQTAETICNTLGITSPIDTPELKEYFAGDIEGLKADDIGEKYPDYNLRHLGERGDFSCYGGESYDDMQARLTRFIDVVVAQHYEDELLVVSHGGTLYQLLKLWCGWPTPRHYFTRLSNCACAKLLLRKIDSQVFAELQWFVPLKITAPGLVE